MMVEMRAKKHRWRYRCLLAMSVLLGACGGGGGGSAPETSDESALPTQPNAPTGAEAVALSESGIELTWIDNSSDEQGFYIERSDDQDSAYRQIGSTKREVTRFVDIELAPDTLYFYRVAAYSGTMISDYSNIVSVRTRPASPLPPAAPSGTAVEVMQTQQPWQVEIRWNDNSGDETGFRIARSCTAVDAGYSEIGSVVTDTTVFRDTSPEYGKTCFYRVLAYNSAGDSGYSSAIGVSVPLRKYILSITKSASGNGDVVQSAPPGGELFPCDSMCWVAGYDEGETVRLDARVLGPGSSFSHWQGCDGTDGTSCTILMNGDRAVTVVFTSTISIADLPTEDGNGEYFLKWTCDSIFDCPRSIDSQNTEFVIEESHSERFDNPVVFTKSRGGLPSPGAALVLTGKKSGRYCYRVSFMDWANWSEPRCVTVSLPPAVLPKTGQYRSLSNYDDGWYRSGITWPFPRFVDNQDGTITDNLTGLMWLTDANCMASHYPELDTSGNTGDGLVSWEKANDFIRRINSGNYSYRDCGSYHGDWRLPNINEILSLTHAGEQDVLAWLSFNGFMNVDVQPFWTSTAGLDPVYVFIAGPVSYSILYLRPERNAQPVAVWPVRTVRYSRHLWQTGQTSCYDIRGQEIDCTGSGQDGEYRSGVNWPDPRLENNQDGTVTDRLTKLMWLADADCMNTHYPHLASVEGTVYWQEALDFIAGMNGGDYPDCAVGHDDWRMPNIIELRSLIDYQTPLVDKANAHGITNLSSEKYWSSTARAHPDGITLFASTVNFATGEIGNAITASQYQRQRLWPVRGGD